MIFKLNLCYKYNAQYINIDDITCPYDCIIIIFYKIKNKFVLRGVLMRNVTFL